MEVEETVETLSEALKELEETDVHFMVPCWCSAGPQTPGSVVWTVCVPRSRPGHARTGAPAWLQQPSITYNLLTTQTNFVSLTLEP